MSISLSRLSNAGIFFLSYETVLPANEVVFDSEMLKRTNALVALIATISHSGNRHWLSFFGNF